MSDSDANATGRTVLEVSGLSTWFGPDAAPVRAVDGVSFTLERGRTVALVGESGCGKTVTGLSIMGLVPAGGRVVAGRVLLDGRNLLDLDQEEMTTVRGRQIAMVFQEPMTSLNPLMTVGNQITEMLRFHLGMAPGAASDRAAELLALVGFPQPARILKEYPHRLSGGMRQRAMIAIALSCDPLVLIADEPTTALDVTIQAQLLELLEGLSARVDTAILLITHNLAVVSEAADRVVVMYCGQVVESAPTAELFARPLHPYTRALLACIPSIDGPRRRLGAIGGTVPSPAALPPGCRFAPRCPHAFGPCPQAVPGITEPEPGRLVRCYLHGGSTR